MRYLVTRLDNKYCVCDMKSTDMTMLSLDTDVFRYIKIDEMTEIDGDSKKYIDDRYIFCSRVDSIKLDMRPFKNYKGIDTLDVDRCEELKVYTGDGYHFMNLNDVNEVEIYAKDTDLSIDMYISKIEIQGSLTKLSICDRSNKELYVTLNLDKGIDVLDLPLDSETAVYTKFNFYSVEPVIVNTMVLQHTNMEILNTLRVIASNQPVLNIHGGRLYVYLLKEDTVLDLSWFSKYKNFKDIKLINKTAVRNIKCEIWVNGVNIPVEHGTNIQVVLKDLTGNTRYTKVGE